jgi:hypothetical protein
VPQQSGPQAQPEARSQSDAGTYGAASAEADGYETVSPDADTTPMPVILARPPANQDPAPVAPQNGPADAGERQPGVQSPPPATTPQRIRGPFEPVKKIAAPSPPASAGSPPAPQSASSAAATPVAEAAGSDVWTPATAKMDQIKDLYLTAEAIGEQALDQHFQQVSERQRQLIREYFDQAVSSQADSGDALQ